jgi:GNAT superfamily N-acetyltransferase
MRTGWEVRARSDDDLAACSALLVAVHHADRYPDSLPAEPQSFLEVADMLGGWVVDGPEGIVGHVVLRQSTSAPVMDLAGRATGLGPERLAVVGRLLVAPSARRRGAGSALLEAAAGRARELGRRPVLDVVRTGDRQPAIELYERCGWQMAGEVTVMFGDRSYDELVYVAPADGG